MDSSRFVRIAAPVLEVFAQNDFSKEVGFQCIHPVIQSSKMVKNIVQIVRDADYEAQHRTLPVSEKPAIGKSLFGDLASVKGSDKFQTSFNSERFIHRDVHKILNRRAGDVAGTPTVQARSTLIKRSIYENDNVRDYSQEIVSKRIASDKSALQALQNLSMQLRAVVIDVNDLGLNCTGRDSVFSANKGITSSFNSSSVTSTSFNSLPKIDEFAFEIVHNRAGSKNVSWNTVDLSKRNVSKRVGARLLFSLRKESGFGTAPIWYQQSMENGPPFPRHFSLD